uniref:Uncharacterized protein n=1 Tax=Caenorhabditis tropicalis TaxID=1561998 RepID=A0A1I7UD30_9PELO
MIGGDLTTKQPCVCPPTDSYHISDAILATAEVIPALFHDTRGPREDLRLTGRRKRPRNHERKPSEDLIHIDPLAIRPFLQSSSDDILISRNA